jgi:hypothetical protein
MLVLSFFINSIRIPREKQQKRDALAPTSHHALHAEISFFSRSTLVQMEFAVFNEPPRNLPGKILEFLTLSLALSG